MGLLPLLFFDGDLLFGFAFAFLGVFLPFDFVGEDAVSCRSNSSSSSSSSSSISAALRFLV